jgi:ribosomal protein L20
MSPLSSLRRGLTFGLVTALLLVLAWGARVDHLRAGYKAALGRILVSIDVTTGRKVTADVAPVTIEALGVLRDRYRQERNAARGLVERQSASIRAAGAETARLAGIAERNRQLAEATSRERDVWISRARAAETRTERLSAEAELEECNAVLDALYRDGF